MQYMSADLIAQAKGVRDDGSIVEIVVWERDEPLAPCAHRYKCRLFFGVPGACFVRYDNERGKRDHRHVEARSPASTSPRWRRCWPISSGTSRTGGKP